MCQRRVGTIKQNAIRKQEAGKLIGANNIMAAFGETIETFFINSFVGIPKIKQEDGSDMTNEKMNQLWNTPDSQLIGDGISGIVRLLNGKAIKKIDIKKLIPLRINQNVLKNNIQSEIQTYYDISMRCSDFVCPFIGYYYNQTTSQLYIQSEYCGKELFLIYAESYPEPNIIVDHIFQILKIIQCLHNHNFVHRDLKLENFTIDTNGKIRVIDFGTCVDLNKDNGKTISRAGTILYLAPEFVDTREIIITPQLLAGDIYSLGVMFLHMVGDNQYINGLNQESFDDKSFFARIASLETQYGIQYINDLWANFENKMKDIFGPTFSANYFVGTSAERKTIDELVTLFETTHNISTQPSILVDNSNTENKSKAKKSNVSQSKFKATQTQKQKVVKRSKEGGKPTRNHKAKTRSRKKYMRK